MKYYQNIIFATVAACTLTSSLHAQSSPSLNQKKNHVELLYLQQASSGELKYIKGTKGCYDLMLNQLHHEIFYFSNTPQRIAGRVAVDKLFTTLTHDEHVDKIVPNGILNAY